jgi:hypothetical protein
MRSGIVGEVCIKEYETECEFWLFGMKKNETVRKGKGEDAQYEMEHMCRVKSKAEQNNRAS